MGFISTIIRQGVGAVQMGMASEELKNLPGSREYSLNQDLATATALARRGAQQGMTPEERAVAGQAIGTQQSRTQRAMEQRGLGNLAAAITQSSATDAFNQLEAANQQIKRDYLGRYGDLGSKVQALENANVTSFNQQLAMQQRELGMAAQQGFAGLAGSGAQIAGMLGDNAEEWAKQFKDSRAAKAQAETEQQQAFDAAGLGEAKTTLGDESKFMQSLGTDDFKPMTAQQAMDASKPGLGGFDSSTGIDPNTGYSTSSIGGIGANVGMDSMGSFDMGEIGTMNMELGTTDYNMDFGSMDMGSMDVGSVDVGSGVN